MDHLDEIQTALKPLKKLKYVLMTILGLAESFKIMNQPSLAKLDSTRLGPAWL